MAIEPRSKSAQLAIAGILHQEEAQTPGPVGSARARHLVAPAQADGQLSGPGEVMKEWPDVESVAPARSGGAVEGPTGAVDAAEREREVIIAIPVREREKQPCRRSLSDMPNELLLQILACLDVCDLLATSRTSRHLRLLSLSPILKTLRLRRTRLVLPHLLSCPSRPSLADLIHRHIFLTKTALVSRQLARNLVTIRLTRRLAARPSFETLVERCVLPPECAAVAPGLVARRRAVEKERLKDALRRWVGSVWKGEVRSREEGVRRWEERAGVGRVWRLRRFWERVARGEGRTEGALS